MTRAVAGTLGAVPRLRLRALILVIAGWAVLFAPGAAYGQSDGARVDSEHISAAVVAPTMGPDAGTLISRSGREWSELERQMVVLPPAAPAAAAFDGPASTHACLEPPGCPPSQLSSLPASTRAPPVV